MDVALITANQWFLKRQLARRFEHSKENPILERWLAEHFSEAEAGGRIALPEDKFLRDALRARGVDAQIAAWDNPAIDWSGVKLCVVRSPGDWCFRTEEFLRWADSAQRVTKIWNSAEVMRWASNKSYLPQLIERGITVVPTCCFPRGAAVDLGRFLEERGWSEAILKPLTGQGSMGIIRTSLSQAAGAKPIGEAQAHLNALLQRHGALVQPYFPAVETDGELSMIYIRGRVTHAVRKFPQPGDFRAYGTPNSRQEAAPVDGAIGDFAERAMRAVGMAVEFCRIDAISDAEGRMNLLELELVQPRLFLSSSTEALDELVGGICSEVGMG